MDISRLTTAATALMMPVVNAVRITRTPAGEAPLWVRQAWVGLELPAAGTRPSSYFTAGVTAKPRPWFVRLSESLQGKRRRNRGYAVPAAAAIDILAGADPRAARWWREQTPHVLRSGQYLLFEESACEPVARPGPTSGRR
jgi:hypothetical protein